MNLSTSSLKSHKSKESANFPQKKPQTQSIIWASDSQLVIRTFPSLKQRKFFQYDSKITAIAYSEAKSLIVFGLKSGKIHFIDTKTLTNVKTLNYVHKGNVLLYRSRHLFNVSQLRFRQ